jgi:proline iminopeptidase
MQIIERYWDEKATEERKEIFANNMELLSKESDSTLTKSQQSIAWYIKAAPKYWYNPSYDCSWLFEDYYWNVDGWNHFFNSIIMGYDIINKEEINVPVFITQAKYDFMAPPTLWEERIQKLPNSSYNFFEQSGHYPHIEEQDLFDRLLIDWIKNL